MDYDKIFKDNLDREFFYSHYQGNKMMDGKISLSNAIARMKKGEYYTLVTYKEGEGLPKEYIPLSTLTSEDETLFATLNPNNRYFYLCKNGGIQMISRLPNQENESPTYLLGPGPQTVTLDDLIMEQYEKFTKDQTTSKGISR